MKICLNNDIYLIFSKIELTSFKYTAILFQKV